MTLTPAITEDGKVYYQVESHYLTRGDIGDPILVGKIDRSGGHKSGNTVRIDERFGGGELKLSQLEKTAETAIQIKYFQLGQRNRNDVISRTYAAKGHYLYRSIIVQAEIERAKGEVRDLSRLWRDLEDSAHHDINVEKGVKAGEAYRRARSLGRPENGFSAVLRGAAIGAAEGGRALSSIARPFGGDFSSQDAYLEGLWDTVLHDDDSTRDATRGVANWMVAAPTYSATGLHLAGPQFLGMTEIGSVHLTSVPTVLYNEATIVGYTGTLFPASYWASVNAAEQEAIRQRALQITGNYGTVSRANENEKDRHN